MGQSARSTPTLSEVDPAHLHAQASSHVVLQGRRPDDADPPRPTVIIDT